MKKDGCFEDRLLPLKYGALKTTLLVLGTFLQIKLRQNLKKKSTNQNFGWARTCHHQPVEWEITANLYSDS